MKATFKNSVSVLVRAYLNDELIHRFCSACAVGNLVAAGIGDRPGYRCFHFDSGLESGWNNVFMTCLLTQTTCPQNYLGEAKRQIDATGYTWQELARIEYAFETADGCPGATETHAQRMDDEWMFNGLLAVVDVLAEIHGVDLTVKENAIGQFQKVHATKP